MGLIIALPSVRCKVFQIIQPSLRDLAMPNVRPNVEGRVPKSEQRKARIECKAQQNSSDSQRFGALLAAEDGRHVAGFGQHA